MTGTNNKIKALISGLISNDKTRVNAIINELSESIIPSREEKIMSIITESIRGNIKNV